MSGAPASSPMLSAKRERPLITRKCSRLLARCEPLAYDVRVPGKRASSIVMENCMRFLIIILALAFCVPVMAQDNAQTPRLKSSLCTRENALTIVQQQVD